MTFLVVEGRFRVSFGFICADSKKAINLTQSYTVFAPSSAEKEEFLYYTQWFELAHCRWRTGHIQGMGGQFTPRDAVRTLCDSLSA